MNLCRLRRGGNRTLYAACSMGGAQWYFIMAGSASSSTAEKGRGSQTLASADEIPITAGVGVGGARTPDAVCRKGGAQW